MWHESPRIWPPTGGGFPIAFGVISAVVAAIRVAGDTSEAFQAAAHILVGGLFGAYFAGVTRVYLVYAVALSAVETLCFLASLNR